MFLKIQQNIPFLNFTKWAAVVGNHGEHGEWKDSLDIRFCPICWDVPEGHLTSESKQPLKKLWEKKKGHKAENCLILSIQSMWEKIAREKYVGPGAVSKLTTFS